MLVAGCDEADPGDEAPVERLDRELELDIASRGRIDATLELDDETISVFVESVGDVRELVVRGDDEYARWTYDSAEQLTVGHIDGHTFGSFEDRFHSLDRAYWDEMRASRAAEVVAAVSEAARRVADSEDLDDPTRLAVDDIIRAQLYVERLGIIPAELEDELGAVPYLPEADEVLADGTVEPAAPVFGFVTEDDPAAACSNASSPGHSISGVVVFTTQCRINHSSWTNKAAGGCNNQRCVQHFHASGSSASSNYCNGGSQYLSQTHLVPRTGGNYGLWSHHTAPGTALDAWIWRSAPCPA